MPCGPEKVGPEDGACIEGLLDVGIRDVVRTQTDGPFGRGVVLSLGGAQPRDDLARFVKPLPRQPVVDQSPGD
jgi:hypothetical protein